MTKAWWKDMGDLDDRQQAVFDIPIEESHLILGPPGSGKTNILLLRASQLVRSGKPNVLILVFTRTLKEFIETGASHYAFSSDKIQTLNQWMFTFIRDHGHEPIKADNFKETRKARVKQVTDIIHNRKLRNMYNAIVLDEAQDYSSDELSIFFALGEVVFAAGDHRQTIYVDKRTKSDSSSTPLASRFGAHIYELKYHYRNGLKICEVADSFAKSWGGFDPLVPTSNYDDVSTPSKVDLDDTASLAIQTQNAIIELDRQVKAYPDEFLAVLCPNNHVLDKVWDIISASPIADLSFVENFEKGYVKFDIQTPICVCTMHAAKGLEFRTVHIVGTENLKGAPQLRELVYTATTRAKTSLTYHFTSPLPPFVDSAFGCLRDPVPVAKLSQLFSSDQ